MYKMKPPANFNYHSHQSESDRCGFLVNVSPPDKRIGRAVLGSGAHLRCHPIGPWCLIGSSFGVWSSSSDAGEHLRLPPVRPQGPDTMGWGWQYEAEPDHPIPFALISII